MVLVDSLRLAFKLLANSQWKKIRSGRKFAVKAAHASRSYLCVECNANRLPCAGFHTSAFCTDPGCAQFHATAAAAAGHSGYANMLAAACGAHKQCGTLRRGCGGLDWWECSESSMCSWEASLDWSANGECTPKSEHHLEQHLRSDDPIYCDNGNCFEHLSTWARHHFENATEAEVNFILSEQCALACGRGFSSTDCSLAVHAWRRLAREQASGPVFPVLNLHCPLR